MHLLTYLSENCLCWLKLIVEEYGHLCKPRSPGAGGAREGAGASIDQILSNAKLFPFGYFFFILI